MSGYKHIFYDASIGKSLTVLPFPSDVGDNPGDRRQGPIPNSLFL